MKKKLTSKFFGDQTADFTINKANFLDSTLVYVNQGNVTPVKGELTVYLDYVIIAQLIPAMNNPENIEEYECLPNDFIYHKIYFYYFQIHLLFLLLFIKCFYTCKCFYGEINLPTYLMKVPLYNNDKENFLGLKKRLAFIMVRGDQDEAFFSYAYDKAKSKKHYSVSKKVLPNIFSGTCFKKH